MSQRIAFFDFDGTITTKDTLLAFITFSKGSLRTALGFLYCSPYIIAYKSGLITNQAAKEKVLSFFFKGTTLNDFNATCSVFAADIIPRLIRPAALLEIEHLKKNDFIVVIVSASPENWLKDWCSGLGLDLLGSRLETKGAIITGKLFGKNCYGKEKVERIKGSYSLSTYTEVHAYGDTPGDKPMLALATSAFYKPFRK